MIINKNFKLSTLWFLGKRNMIQSFLLSTIVVVLYVYFNIKILAVPSILLASIGTAVAFYVGFKNNQAYERQKKASEVWESIFAQSKIFFLILKYHIHDSQIIMTLYKNHLMYLNLLKIQLKKPIPWNLPDSRFISINRSLGIQAFDYKKEYQKIIACYGYDSIEKELKLVENKASAMLQKQYQIICKDLKNIDIAENEYSELIQCLNRLNQLQVSGETIKNIPVFRQYSNFSHIFTNLFNFLLPFTLLSEFNHANTLDIWLTVPFSVLISWVFYTMEQIGDVSESLFENSAVDIPLDFFCTLIEKELSQICDIPIHRSIKQNVHFATIIM